MDKKKSELIKRISKNNNKSFYYGRKAIAFILITVLTLSLAITGCGKTADQDENSSTNEDVQKSEQDMDQTQDQSQNIPQSETEDGKPEEQEFPRKVKDAGGYEFTIESEPKKIVSLTLGSDEMLFGLVNKERILALTRYAEDEGISNIAKEAAQVAERATMENIEAVIALKPDLAILDTWADPNYIKQLRDTGINVYTFKTPNNIDEQKTVISEIAYVTGADDKGRELISWMDAKLNEIEDKLSELKPEEKLTVMDYGEMGSSGLGTNFDDIVTRAGLINVISREGIEGWPVISKEKIIEYNPDMIILPSWYYDQKNSLQGMIDTLKNDKSLQTVSAIKEDRLIAVSNPHISAISQYVVLAVEDVAKAAYPELFK